MRKTIAAVAAFLLSVALSGQTRWYDPLLCGGGVQGQGWPELNKTYVRMPDGVEDVVRPDVWGLSRQSAGLYLVFRTDAGTFTVRYKVKGNVAMYHMPATGVSGLDLYATDRDGFKRWLAPHFPCKINKDGCEYLYENITRYPDGVSDYEYHLYLPLYNSVESLEIGVPEKSAITFCASSIEKPIVVYGTSIAQGACASRPGNCWTGILDRELDHPVVNLGFSGNGRLEPEVIGALAEIDAQMYILDCLPNLHADTHPVKDLTYNAVVQLRQARDCPILLVEHSGYMAETGELNRSEYRLTNCLFRKAYEELVSDGVKGLYYLTSEEIGLGMDGMVESAHPNDLGMRRQADAVEAKVREILHENTRTYQPRTQSRDTSSPAWERHQDALKLILSNPRSVILGDSAAELRLRSTTADLRNPQDRIENVLWRVFHGELDGYDAENVIIALGPGNLSAGESCDKISDGIDEILDAVAFHQNKAKIYIVTETPDSFIAKVLKMRIHSEKAIVIEGIDAAAKTINM